MSPFICRHVPRGHPTSGHPRSPHWPKVEHEFLAANPACKGCGGRTNLNVHHILPFHLHPEKELDPTNLVTVCRQCHYVLGHLNNWSFYNPDAVTDLVRHAAQREAASGRADRPPDRPGDGLAGPPDQHRPHVEHAGGGGRAGQPAG